MSEWQPIHTAPTDGTTVILFRPAKVLTKKKAVRDKVMLGRWIAPDGEVNAHKHELLMRHDGYWSAHFLGERPIDGLPTHWMAVPPFPTRGDESPYRDGE